MSTDSLSPASYRRVGGSNVGNARLGGDLRERFGDEGLSSGSAQPGGLGDRFWDRRALAGLSVDFFSV